MSSLLYHPSDTLLLEESVVVIVFSRNFSNFAWRIYNDPEQLWIDIKSKNDIIVQQVFFNELRGPGRNHTVDTPEPSPNDFGSSTVRATKLALLTSPQLSLRKVGEDELWVLFVLCSPWNRLSPQTLWKLLKEVPSGIPKSEGLL